MSKPSFTYGSEAAGLVRRLTDEDRLVPLDALSQLGEDLEQPGLYAWYVDMAGAASIASGLGVAVGPGLVYGGEAGAGLSRATLRSRIVGNHLRGNVTGSTFRLTLASILATELRLSRDGGRALAGDGEGILSAWMTSHLRVAIAPVVDRARLAVLEAVVLADLDPPLNLQGMTPSDVRTALRQLRRRLNGRGRPAAVRTARPRPVSTTPTGGAPDMRAFLSGFIGRTIATLSGRPNRIIDVTVDAVLVGSARSPHGRAVPLASVQDAADRLFEQGELTIDVATVGYRSAFIGAALAALPGTRASTKPRRIVLVDQDWPPASG